MQATQNALVKTASTTPSNYLFATLSDEPEADLLTSQPYGSPPADSCASRMALQPAVPPVVQIVTHQSDVEASMLPVPALLPLSMMQSPSASNDRITLLQMSATRRGIAAGMRL